MTKCINNCIDEYKMATRHKTHLELSLNRCMICPVRVLLLSLLCSPPLLLKLLLPVPLDLHHHLVLSDLAKGLPRSKTIDYRKTIASK